MMHRAVAKCALVLALVLVSAAAETEIRCAVCKKDVGNKYLRSDDGAAYCSKRCFRKLLPKCTKCGKVIEGKYLTSKGKKFCSNRCFKTTLRRCEICGERSRRIVVIDDRVFCQRCGKFPRCNICRMPDRYISTLPDGRILCKACDAVGTFNHDQARKLFRQAIDELKTVTHQKSRTTPTMKMVGMGELIRIMKVKRDDLDPSVMRGFYQRTIHTTINRFTGRETRRPIEQDEEKIYILYGLSRNDFICTAVHELMHDIASEVLDGKEGIPTWVEEGMCQYVAAQVCRRNKWKSSLEAIENCPDSTYGDSYRYLESRFGKNNFAAAWRWVRSTDPSDFPKVPPKRK